MGCLMVKTPRFHCPGSISGQGTRILQAGRCSQKKEKVYKNMQTKENSQEELTFIF